jgi:hypothetical protein
MDRRKRQIVAHLGGPSKLRQLGNFLARLENVGVSIMRQDHKDLEH